MVKICLREELWHSYMNVRNPLYFYSMQINLDTLNTHHSSKSHNVQHIRRSEHTSRCKVPTCMSSLTQWEQITVQSSDMQIIFDAMRTNYGAKFRHADHLWRNENTSRCKVPTCRSSLTQWEQITVQSSDMQIIFDALSTHHGAKFRHADHLWRSEHTSRCKVPTCRSSLTLWAHITVQSPNMHINFDPLSTHHSAMSWHADHLWRSEHTSRCKVPTCRSSLTLWAHITVQSPNMQIIFDALSTHHGAKSQHADHLWCSEHTSRCKVPTRRSTLTLWAHITLQSSDMHVNFDPLSTHHGAKSRHADHLWCSEHTSQCNVLTHRSFLTLWAHITVQSPDTQVNFDEVWLWKFDTLNTHHSKKTFFFSFGYCRIEIISWVEFYTIYTSHFIKYESFAIIFFIVP